MPPIRTASVAKPVRTERTHEENQERAYIAASRRSDRSLEARMESARRASDIHKKRTGRALRVNESDVVNEEMYEEEDDDLPAQYRRLTAHLHTNSMDFNRRLHAYLASQAGVRNALLHNIPFQSQQYANSPQFAPHMMQHNMEQQNMPYRQQMQPQMVNRSPSNFQQSPSPNPNQGQVNQQTNYPGSPQGQMNFQHQSPSMPDGSGFLPFQSGSPLNSMPGDSTGMTGSSNTPQPGTSAQSMPSPTRTASTATHSGPETSSPQQQMMSPSFSQNGMMHSPFVFNPMSPNYNTNMMQQWNNDTSASSNPFGLFSTSLPVESQQLLAGAFEPLNSSLMPGGDFMPQPQQQQQQQQPFYSYKPNAAPMNQSSPRSRVNVNTNMNQTLAPDAFDGVDPSNRANFTPPSATPDSIATPWSTTFSMDATMPGDEAYADFDPAVLKHVKTAQSSGQVTPFGEDFFDWGAAVGLESATPH
ncbi:hypothetical protein K402DRAFT_406339 [Aulographum hederae CBS 113979]|uniref:Uncharacterized protein n=1 Tax=Aulographum hederae CBS 113979 TaxID=1176131 RepID=A0A6G1GTK7_9PEZI|nr:hypothetical protein K402DRAFT_406339 [Aulographum hederae CBS 113979]